MAANTNTVQGGAWQVTSSLVVNNAVTKTLTHNRGRKAQAVLIVDSTNRATQALTFTVAQVDANTIAVTNGTGGNLTVDVIIFWDPPSQDNRAAIALAAWV